MAIFLACHISSAVIVAAERGKGKLTGTLHACDRTNMALLKFRKTKTDAASGSGRRVSEARVSIVRFVKIKPSNTAVKIINFIQSKREPVKVWQRTDRPSAAAAAVVVVEVTWEIFHPPRFVRTLIIRRKRTQRAQRHLSCVWRTVIMAL